MEKGKSGRKRKKGEGDTCHLREEEGLKTCFAGGGGRLLEGKVISVQNSYCGGKGV